MATTPTAKREITCELCSRTFSVLSGDGATVCKDKVKCEDRQRARGLKTVSQKSPALKVQLQTAPPPPAATDESRFRESESESESGVQILIPSISSSCTFSAGTFSAGFAPEPEPELGSSEYVARKQKALAARAITTSEKILDHIDHALENGVEMIFKDGSSAVQSVQPMALSAMLRELRPIVQEPIRAAEAKDQNNRPLISLNLNDPEVSRQAVEALRARRERRQLSEAAPKDDQS